MKSLTRISAAAALVTLLAMPAWAGIGQTTYTYRTTTTTYTAQPNPQLIADLQEASQNALRDGRDGDKNNPYFAQKSARIDNLIARLEAGQQVSGEEIDQALAKPDLY